MASFGKEHDIEIKNKAIVKPCRPSGENVIKAELIINAFENYRMQSWFYRVLKFLKIR